MGLPDTKVTAQTRDLIRVPAPVGERGEVQNLYSGSYALLIGVSKYDHSTAWAPLETVPGELASLADALALSGFQEVEQVLNPSGRELRDAVTAFIRRFGYNAENRIVIFFSGHGFTLDDGVRGYVVPRDAPDPRDDEHGFRAVAISMQQVATWAEDMLVKHAMFAFDSCFSGTIFRTRDRSVPVPVSRLTAKPVRYFLTAGGAGEPVPARSVFTPSIVRALRGDADLDQDGFVTGTELGNFVQREVIAYRTRQTPQFGKIRDPRFDEGDIVFAVSAPVSPPNQSSKNRQGDAVALRAGEDVPYPTRRKFVDPVYPDVARMARIQGIVLIDVIIDVRGRVVDPTVSLGKPLLTQAALEAVRQWEYEITYRNGVPTPVRMTVVVDFFLR